MLPGAVPEPTIEDASRADLTRRASAGVFIVASRGVLVLLVGFGGTVVLARLLAPHDFGVVAIGTSVVAVIALFSDGGLGASLIRRQEPPTIQELQALTAFQLAVTTLCALGVVGVASFFGQVGWVVALMATSTPIVVLQFPGRIHLERSLSYRPLALVEVGQVLTYYIAAVALVVAGLGVWGLASATIVMRVVAGVMMVRLSPLGLVTPRFSWQHLRHLLGFGIRFQATSATTLLRDQGLTASVAAIAGTTTLGLWSLAKRLLEIPFLLFEPLLRVSFPTMSQLVARKEETSDLIERAAGMAAVASGMVLAALAASAPGLIPGLFGERWRAAAGVVPPACLGLAIGGSIVVATHGYLYAIGDATLPLRAHLVQSVLWLAVALPLLPVVGVAAVGLGWLVGTLGEAVVLERGVQKWTRVDLVSPLLAPILVGVVSAGVGWEISRATGADLVSGILGGLTAVVLFHGLLLALRRRLLLDTYRFAMRAMRAAAPRPTA